MNKIIDINKLGIAWRDSRCAEKIIHNLQESKQQVLVTDYDGTLTSNAGGNWYLMGDILPSGGQKEHRELREVHIPLEKAGKLSDQRSREWSEAALKLHILHKTPISKIEKAIQSSELRQGAVDFIQTCHSKGMFIMVVSAGVETPINLAAQKHGLQFDEVIAARLLFNEEGIVKNWDQESLIIPGNKQERCSLVLSNKPNFEHKNLGFLVVGDKRHDSSMVDPALAKGGNDNILRIMVGVDSSADQKDIDEIWNSSFDGIVFGDSLDPLTKLAKQLI